ncbi:MAG: TRAP transporter large permease subunit, partial [Aestuariivirga sp.]
VGLFCLYIFAITILQPARAPALPIEARTLGSGVASLFVVLLMSVVIGVMSWWLLQGNVARGAGIWGTAIAATIAYGVALIDKRLKYDYLSHLAQQVIIVLIPPLALIFLVLGTIFLGIATATEGGAMGATGALLMAWFKGRLPYRILSEALDGTTRLACFVMFILIGSRVFSLTFYGVNGHIWVEELMTGLPGGVWGFLIAVNALVFVLGCFIDFFEIAFIVIPLLAPVAQKLGIDLVWFGIIIGMNMQTSFLTPPFGFALFYMRSVAPNGPWVDKPTGRTIAGVTTAQIYRGGVAFIILQVIMVAIVIAFPWLSIGKGEIKVDTDKIEITLPSLD